MTAYNEEKVSKHLKNINKDNTACSQVIVSSNNQTDDIVNPRNSKQKSILTPRFKVSEHTILDSSLSTKSSESPTKNLRDNEINSSDYITIKGKLHLNFKLIQLVCSLTDDKGNQQCSKFYTDEINEAKLNNKIPITFYLKPSGQRDIADILFEEMESFIKENEKIPIKNSKYLKDFDDDLIYQLNYKKNVIDFYRKLYKKLKIQFSTIISSFILLDRIIQSNKIILTYSNIFSLYGISLNLAYNYNEDKVITNSCFCALLNKDNKAFVKNRNKVLDEVLCWKLHVSTNEYTSFIFWPLSLYCSNNDNLINHIMNTQEQEGLKRKNK